mmetsp:Transcript_5946/g.11710  ORF Transcript_5946/g.11710 Transcript_5946/m.11710 type:complete len:80 (+) Transcript_5946:895-1134(+)
MLFDADPRQKQHNLRFVDRSLAEARSERKIAKSLWRTLEKSEDKEQRPSRLAEDFAPHLMDSREGEVDELREAVNIHDI